MQSILSSHHFILDEVNGVWRPEELPDFAYSDGDNAENYILDAINSAQDVSVNSTELHDKIRDWSSRYHLSTRRANLLRPFGEWFRGKRVLEIGCGCGAMSRFIGESGAQLVSVEGSFRRASIARQRCRDLTNVEVICSPSDLIPDLGLFDAVMLIGVLEYASVFLGKDGQQTLLASCRSRMTADARLFVAIENKLGIKYFAGANEDHVNMPMFGINNAYHEQGVMTFGRQELKAVLAKAGFNASQEYLPLPDYKLPISMVTPDGWQHHAMDLAPLAVESTLADHQLIAESTFSVEQGIKNAWHNGLAADLSNSFMMIATQQPQPSLTPDIAAFHFSDSRQAAFRKTTTFTINSSGRLIVHAVKGNPDEPLPGNLHYVVDQDEFYRGKSLWLDLVDIVNRHDWRVSEVADWARSWIDCLLARAGLPIVYDLEQRFPKGYLDAMPFNIIRQDNGEVVLFDQEWESPEDISVAYIAFRGIFISLLRISSFSYSQFYTETHLLALVLDVLKTVGFKVEQDHIERFLQQDARFYALIDSGNEQQIFHALSACKIVLRAPSVDFLRLEVYTMGQEYAVKEQQNIEQAAVIVAQKQDIERFLHSTSWRISAPLRIVARHCPLILRRIVHRIVGGLSFYGRAIKLNINQVRQATSMPSATIRSAPPLKLRVRKLLKSVYLRVPQRYRGRLLTVAMWVRPGWFLHHPSFRRQRLSGDMSPVESASINRAADGSYYYSKYPDDYTYIATEKPYHFDEIIGGFVTRPKFSIIVPIYNTPLELLEKMISSVRRQWYPDWELVLVNDASPLAETAIALDALDDPRIKVIHLASNQGIAGATNVAIEHATNDYIVFLDHDDELTEDCLYELAKCINVDDPDFIYSDEDKLTPEGSFSQPHFKPDWSPETMMGTMYTCHVSCVRLSVAQGLGGLRGEFNGCQDWDFILRLTEVTNKISHIAKVLYHWRIIPASIASDLTAKPYVLAASKAVRESALNRRGQVGTVEPLPNCPGFFRVNYAPQGNPLISIIIPTRDNRAFLQRCVESIFDKTHFDNIELVVVDNGSKDADTVEYLEQLKADRRVNVVHHDRPFNFSQLINAGVAHSTGDLLLLLNDDTEVLHGDWLERMAGYAQLDHIGAVGAKLLYSDGVSVQHAGLLNLHDGPMHAFLNQHKDIAGYFMRNQVDYNWLAVTGACLMIERKKYLSIGGFDETFPVAYNDVDFCMSLVDAGFYNVTCQSVTLIHHESVSRGIDHKDLEKHARLKREQAHLYNKHPNYFQYDPFFNINLHPNGYNFEVQK
ncbi:glycosyltransferase [Acerihabitans sp. TG2]|uniref:glycosyltransferase n=1 Tax=Acerihabitans sp. TG2 TaxID=3096008 RepID=UPI002B23B217|nr:glycosyltransferase [Acerihabitans sp. TG2]MEA9393424.1 glycosyltransferase [Acerihabitans sp. TG2]